MKYTCIFDILDWQVFLVFLTLPIAIDLYKSMILYASNDKDLCFVTPAKEIESGTEVS